MQQTQRSGRKSGKAALAALFSFALIAGACGSKKDDATPSNTTDAGTEATDPPTKSTEAQSTDPGTPPTNPPAPIDTTPPPTNTPVTDPGTKPVPGGKIVISGEAETANPWTPGKMQCDSYCQHRARTFYEPLTAFGVDNKAHPFLAESVTPNDDMSVWTVKLRAGVKFHDGEPMNADAAIKNLQLAGGGLLIAKALVDVAKNADGSMMIDKVDDMTFTIKTGKGGDATKPIPWESLPMYMSGQWGLMASPKWLDATLADPALESQPVGTGPFMYKSYVPNDKLVVVKNPNYWQKDADGVQLPYLDEIEFRVINDAVTAQNALENGDIDVFSTSAGQVVAEFRDNADFPMIEQQELGETGHVLLHMTERGGALQDERIRCAMAKSIVRTEIIEATGGGILTPANGPFSPGQEGYLADNGFSLEQDMEAAQALVEEYKAEKGVDEVKVILGRTPDALNDTNAELLSGWWEEAGLTVDSQTVEQSSYITNALVGVEGFQAYLWRNHGGVSVDQQYFWWHSSAALPDDGGLSLNFGRLIDPEVDRLLDEARVAPTREDRVKAAEDLNRYMASKCFIIPISWTIWGTPHDPAIQGFGTNPIPGTDTFTRDGAGFPGSFWTHTLWVQQ